MSVIFATTMGMNFSNTFQSTPIKASKAISQIAALGTGVVKTYNYTQTDVIEEAKKTKCKLF